MQIRQNLAKFDRDLTGSSEISLDPVRLPLDLVEISLDLGDLPKSDINLVETEVF